MNTRGLLILLFVGCLLSCTTKVESDWAAAKEKGTREAYSAFLAIHKTGRYAEDAKQRLALIDKGQEESNTSQEAGRILQVSTLEWFLFFAPNGGEFKSLIEKNENLARQTGFAKFIEVEAKPEPTIRSRQGYSMRQAYEVLTGSVVATTSFIFLDAASTGARSQSDASIVRAVKDHRLVFPLEKIGTGHGYQFGDEWDTPVVTTGSTLPRVRFRRGAVSLLNGEIRVSDGTEAEIHGRIVKLPEHRIAIAPSKHERLFLVFKAGSWRRLEIPSTRS